MNAFMTFYWMAIASLLLYAMPAVRTPGARLGLLIPAVLGVVLTVYEIFMTFVWGPTVTGPIRVDIFLVVPVAALGHVIGGFGLLSARQRRGLPRGFLVIFLIPAVALLGLGYEVWQVRQESKRLTANFFEANRLLFEARFRDPETLRRTFGDLAADGQPLAGHWRREQGSPPSRLVINAEGGVWAFYACGDTECLGGQGRVEDEKIVTTHDILPAYEFNVSALTAGRMTLERLQPPANTHPNAPAQPTSIDFIKEPPPLQHASEQAGELEFLGSYSTLSDRSKAHLILTEAWLWQGPQTVYAVVVHDTLVKGRTASFIRPILFAAGTQAERANAYTFESEDREGAVQIELIDANRVRVTLQRGRVKTESLALRKNGSLSDEALVLAPTASAEAWQHWFDTVMTGRFFTWTAPDTVGDTAE
ncbi:hypothetical protein [Nitrospina watsonii]|uniref:Uncharacterized protein n=1 Tax=Nitrospina watsonii TaxID=1323948 RepID=A0ABM9HGX0_9BACT|nr:hypothetical protein [Nitrospina watsonii]CAI2719485.1 conserved membrane protein of unknown function [Nitrospina watsonii]